MLWNRLKKEKHLYQDSARAAIEKLEAGDIGYLREVYSIFSLNDSLLVGRAGSAVGRFMEGRQIEQLLKIGGQFRSYTSLEWAIDWREIRLADKKWMFLSEEDYVRTLILGSFHPNGYYRERCVAEMAGYPGMLPFIVLRVNDWVGNIRHTAMKTAGDRTARCELEELLLAQPALDKVRRSGRREREELQMLETMMEARLKRDISKIPPALLLRQDCAVRVSVYRQIFSNKLMDIQTADFLLDRERNSFCQFVIIRGILKNYDCSQEQLDRYLAHRSARVRRAALEHKYMLGQDEWPGLETMLLDGSRGIREFTAFILERHRNFDVRGFYAGHLTDKDPAISITGIGETGDRKMAPLLTPFLTDPSEKTVRCALLSLCRLIGRDGEEIYWSYLFDERRSVSKAAYCSIRNSGIHYGAARLYESRMQSGQEHVRRYLTWLLMQENSWDRLPYLVELYGEEENEEYSDRMLKCMGVRSLYAKLTAKQTLAVEAVLGKYGNRLPEKLIKEIQFDLRILTG